MKKKLTAFVLALCLVLVLVGCYPGMKNYEMTTNLIGVDGKQNLYYDPSTYIVYFIFNESTGDKGYGYMSPYYAPNGLPYLYDVESGELVEIER